jgi:hypothetical protein
MVDIVSPAGSDVGLPAGGTQNMLGRKNVEPNAEWDYIYEM